MNKTLLNAIVRGLIVDILNEESPSEVSDKTMLVALQTVGYEELLTLDVRRHYEFLSGAGLLEITKKSREFWMSKITSNGTLFIEGEFEAAGVKIPR